MGYTALLDCLRAAQHQQAAFHSGRQAICTVAEQRDGFQQRGAAVQLAFNGAGHGARAIEQQFRRGGAQR